MLNRVRYFSETERVKLLEEYKNMYLIREENIIDGDFLVFSDVKPNQEETENAETESKESIKIKALEIKVKRLEEMINERR